MKLFELLIPIDTSFLRLMEATEHDLSKVERQLNVKWLDLDYTLTYEEEQMLKDKGIDISKMGLSFEKGKGPQRRKIPVVYTHMVNQTDNDGLLHALKMRHPEHTMKPELIQQMIDESIAKLMGNDRVHPQGWYPEARNHGMETIRRHLTLPADRMKRTKLTKDVTKAIIVLAPSTAKLTEMYAQALAEASGCQLFDGMIKYPFPSMSAKMKSLKKGYFDPSDMTKVGPDVERQRNLQRMESIEAEVKKLEAELDTSEDESIIDKLIKLGDEYKDLMVKTDEKTAKWNKKTMQSFAGMSRRMYGYVRPGEQASQLHEQPIIIVDDNTVTNETIAEVIKSLLRAGIVPKIVGGICLHRYYSKGENENPNELE